MMRFDSFLTSIMEKLEKTLEEISYLRKEMDEQSVVIKNLQHNVKNNWDDGGIELDIPVRTLDEFRKFNQQLKDSRELLNAFRRHLEKRGGRELKHRVSIAMCSVMTYELGTQITWTGRNSVIKFSTTTVAETIRSEIVS